MVIYWYNIHYRNTPFVVYKKLIFTTVTTWRLISLTWLPNFRHHLFFSDSIVLTLIPFGNEQTGLWQSFVTIFPNLTPHRLLPLSPYLTDIWLFVWRYSDLHYISITFMLRWIQRNAKHSSISFQRDLLNTTQRNAHRLWRFKHSLLSHVGLRQGCI